MNVICYGDSNTWGYDPRGYFGGRYDKPWPELLAEKIGWNVLNQGENGREIPRTPVKFPEDTGFLIITLGTNDLLQGNSVDTAAKRMEVFLESIHLEKTKLLLIAPPFMKLGEWVAEQKLIAASTELTKRYQELSVRLGIRFANADEWNVSIAYDGVHFTQEGHIAFADGLIDYLRKEGI